MLLFIITLLNVIDSLIGCRIDSTLHGVYKRQMHSNRNLIFDSTFKDPIVYDEITISATSISDYGDCYEQIGQSYIFGLKRMGRPICYRCITPILRSANIIQLALQQGANPEPATCYIDGRFSLDYSLKGANLKCEAGSGSEVDNCQSSNSLAVKFRNCSFPDFDMYLKCVGSFRGPSNERYIILENEESEEYRCGLLVTSSSQELVIHFSNDSSCALLSASTAFETYRLRPVQSEQVSSPCQFPNWIRGEYDSLTVTADWLEYAPIGEGMVAVISRCVQLNEDRVMVYSETKCGEPLGYHCLWFAPRSESLIEFKTTTPREDSNSSICGADDEFAQWPWTAAVINNARPSTCGVVGQYATPIDLRTEDCYNVSVGCESESSIKITASHCSNDVVFDSRHYQCIASWRDEDSLYLYTLKDQDTRTCFVAHFSTGRFYLSSTGAHCTRGFNFADNAEKTIVLEEKSGCSPTKPKTARRPMSPAMKSSVTAVLVEPIIEGTTERSKAEDEAQSALSEVADPQWTSDPMLSAVPNAFFALWIVLYCLIAL
ncbi:hypothetical protein RB195_020825 [Necator americanus]|uniref:Uncharacterized protein n=1 Tax=Necator americanus TaxID=51031 RepID=A0ABR1CKP6_NECAM